MMYSTPPTSICAVRMMRSTLSMMARGGCAASTFRPSLVGTPGASTALNAASVPGWQMSAGQRLKPSSGFGKHLDGVRGTCRLRFDANNMTVARREVFLYQCRLVDAQVKFVVGNRLGQFRRRLKTADFRAAAADVGLDDDREGQPVGPATAWSCALITRACG